MYPWREFTKIKFICELWCTIYYNYLTVPRESLSISSSLHPFLIFIISFRFFRSDLHTPSIDWSTSLISVLDAHLIAMDFPFWFCFLTLEYGIFLLYCMVLLLANYKLQWMNDPFYFYFWKDSSVINHVINCSKNGSPSSALRQQSSPCFRVSLLFVYDI